MAGFSMGLFILSIGCIFPFSDSTFYSHQTFGSLISKRPNQISSYYLLYLDVFRSGHRLTVCPASGTNDSNSSSKLLHLDNLTRLNLIQIACNGNIQNERALL